MIEPEKPPQAIADLAEACVRFVRDALGLQLDYTSETLPILDHYLHEAARGARSEVHALLAPAAGAYFGELVRRQLAGVRWHAPDADYARFRLEFEPFFLCFNPIGVAMEVLQQADAEGWGAHFGLLDDARPTVEHALERNLELAPEDYYTFSMRYETLEQIADLLSGLESRQAKPRRFGPEIYRAATRDTAAEDPSRTN